MFLSFKLSGKEDNGINEKIKNKKRERKEDKLKSCVFKLKGEKRKKNDSSLVISKNGGKG